jgi:hypothetical protein
MISFDGITLFFKLINTGLVVCIGVYVIKKYFLDTLYGRMLSESEVVNDLYLKEHNLAQEKNKMDQLIQEDAKEYAILQQKIVQWKMHVAHENELQIQEKKAIQITIAQRVNRQSEYIVQRHAHDIALPMVLAKTRESLMIDFANEKRVYDFLDRIIKKNMGES